VTTSLSALYVYLLCVAQEETSPKLAMAGWERGVDGTNADDIKQSLLF
jgi:hypothetical protein